MISSREIAERLVRGEENEKIEKRISVYSDQINRQVKKIIDAQASGQSSVYIVYNIDIGENIHAEAERVRQALIEMQYNCGNVESKQGEWTNGKGYERLIQFEVRNI